MTTRSLGARVGQRVKYERDRRSITRLGLARTAGLSIAYLQQLENANVRNPTPETMAKLSGALGVSVDELSAGVPGLESEAAELRQRIADLVRTARATLPPEEADAVIRSLAAHLESLVRA